MGSSATGIPGEVPREKLSDLVGIIRRQIRVKGKVEEVGDWLEWTSDGNSIHITVQPGQGHTKIQFMGDAGFKLVGVYGPITLASIITLAGLGDGGALTVPLAAGILVVAYAAARFLWTRAAKRSGRKYRRMVDRLTAEIARLAESQVSTIPSPEASEEALDAE